MVTARWLRKRWRCQLKPDEHKFLVDLYLYIGSLPYSETLPKSRDRTARGFIEMCPQSKKSCLRWLVNAHGNGLFEYGINLELGWFTPEGIEAVEAMISEDVAADIREAVYGSP